MDEVAHRMTVGDRQRRSLRGLIALAAFASLIGGTPAFAQDRDHVFAWIAPSEPVDAYTLRLGQASEDYTQQVDLTFLQPDADGITRSLVTLDSSLGYYVSMTASYQGAESNPSNEIFVPASVCAPASCDDANPCTADDCDATGCTHNQMPDGMVCGAPDQTCDAGICQLVDCNDGDVCTGFEFWDGSTCTVGTPLDCGVATQCADPVCDTVDGCMMLARPDGLSCDDGNPSTELDRCEVGWCVGDPIPCFDGDSCLQSKKQSACMNVLTKDLAKTAGAQSKTSGKCIKGQAKSGESAAGCIAALDWKLDKIRAKTDKHRFGVCRASPPEFGPNESSPISDAAVQAELGMLDDLFGLDLDSALVNAATDKSAAKCQAAVFKGAAKCQSAWLKEFAKCQATGLKRGTITSEASLGDCFASDPKRKVAKTCNRLGTKILPKTCVARAVDLSDAFPGHSTDSAGQLATQVRQDAECRVCEALSATHGLPLDCSTCP
jgi:hypothetical protein